MKLDTRFSTSRSENERLEREKQQRNTRKPDTAVYGDDGYIIEDFQPQVKKPAVKKTQNSSARTARPASAPVKKTSQPERKPVRKVQTSEPVRQTKAAPVKKQVPKKQPQKPVKKKRSGVSTGFLWILMFAAAAALVFAVCRLPFLTNKIKFLAAGACAVLLLVTGAATSILNQRNWFQKFVNLTLTAAMLICAVLIPYYEDRISTVIDRINGNTVRISMYALTDEYKAAHPADFVRTIEVPEPGKKIKLKEYQDAVYGTFTVLDGDNQKYALEEMKEAFNRPVPYHKDYDSARHCAEALYSNEIDVIIMSESYVGFIESSDDFESFSQDTQVLYTFEKTIESDLLIKTDADLCEQPYTIFFGGNDEEGELSLQGRTDVDMLVSVNPKTGQIAIISMPRDSFVPNPYFDGAEDKLTHLGIHGLDNTLDGLNDFLDIKIDYYVLVNFTTFMRIIEALGGVEVDNPYEFDYTWDDYSYPEGRIHLDGQAALYYVRERYNLPDGDFGRSMHQQIVMKAIIDKLTSPALLANFNALIKAMDGTFLTNLSSSSIYGLCQYQLDEMIDWNIVNYHVEGDFGMEYTASDPNELSVVYPYDNQVDFVKKVIRSVYKGETLEQQEMPYGDYDY